MFDLLLAVLAALKSALRTPRRTRSGEPRPPPATRRSPASPTRPPLAWTDRLFWVALSRAWAHWPDVLIVVKPETVVRWHRSAFRKLWTWRSRRPPGRPRTNRDVRDLVRRMAGANPTWGAPRIHGELLKIGVDIGERTVSAMMPRRPRKPPSQCWRTFLENHVGTLVSVDFFTVATATFRVLFVFVVLAHHRRRVLHFNVTEHPTAVWAAQQIVEAFPETTTPRYLLRDRDGIFGAAFRRRVAGLGIEEVLTAPRSPWQNSFAERLVGSIRRDCLDHVIVLGERHLHRILVSYFAYYHRSRTHLSLDKDAPEPRQVSPSEAGDVVELPEVGGLHHRYERRLAA